MNNSLPRWADLLLIPFLNLALAFLVAGLVVLSIGENPLEALRILLWGALWGFSGNGYGYTLFYATNFIFTGLAVAIAFHGSLFNIGGEGQAGVAGIGVALVALSLGGTHWLLVLPLAVIGGALFGAAWAAIPAYLQAKRGSHVVITTIMFNFIASALLVYLLVNVMKVEGSMAPESRKFGDGASIPAIDEMAGWFGFSIPNSPMNLTFFIALAACFFTWVLIWRTKLGYEIRAFGQSESAAVYAGISPLKITMVAMLLSGGMAGLMAVNTVLGDSQRLVLDAVQGAGFVGIAVALMGRSHPVGVLLAAILFGVLYQGGAELAFEMPAISREMIVVIQALVILFTGALENLVRFPVQRLFLRRRKRSN
jgi:general nucleoside transport system permease protein